MSNTGIITMPLVMSAARASGVNRTLQVSLRRLMLTFCCSNTSSAGMGWGRVWLVLVLGLGLEFELG